jgi:hypothetical protein
MIVNQTKIRNVNNLTETQRQQIFEFLLSKINSRLSTNPKDWFRVLDLVGKENSNWNDTPLHVLYDKYFVKNKNDKDAFKNAAKDCGWLLKKLIQKDNREFVTKKERTRCYKLVGK